MTRKDFNLIADALKAAKPPLDARFAYNQWVRDTVAVNTALKVSYPRFNEVKFLTACGVEGDLVAILSVTPC